MNLKLTPQQAAKIAKHDQFDNAEKAFEAARAEAKGSREALYYALSTAYYWYLQINRDFTLLTDKLDRHEPKIKWHGQPKNPAKPVMPWDAKNPNDPNIPVDPFTPIVKLIFDYADRKYASTVMTYARCLRFVDREVHDEAKFAAIYEDHIGNPELAKNIIEAAGGVVACAEDQHKFENPSPGKDATKEQLEDFWEKEFKQIYLTKTPLSTVSIPTSAPTGSFLLMVGRVDSNGQVEVVETLNRKTDELLSIAETEAFQDVSTLAPALNILADSMGFLDVFKIGEKPVLTVEKGGSELNLSLGMEHAASIVVTARMKDGNTLPGFTDRAYLAPEQCKWFKSNAQEHKYRRVYQIQQINAAGSINAFELESSVTQEKKTLHFNKLAQTARQQVILDRSNSSNWNYEIDLDRSDLISLHMGWCDEWRKAFKNKDKKSGLDRVIGLRVTDTELSLSSQFAIRKAILAIDTDLPKDSSFEVTLSGHDFANVVEQLLTYPNFDTYKLRGLVTGVIELEAEDSFATYSVDIPMLIEHGKRYSDKHFAKLI